MSLSSGSGKQSLFTSCIFSELGLEDRDLEGWEDVESEDLDSASQDEDMEERDFTGM